MKRNYPLPAMTTRTKAATALLGLWLLVSHSFASTSLTPYRATYHAELSGWSATVIRQLRPLADDQWQLTNNASVMFAGFDEQARLQQQSGKITPLHYQYSNALSSKRNKTIEFDWQAQSARTVKGKQPAVSLPIDGSSYDQLSFQLQLQLDLQQQGEQFSEKAFTIVDTGKLKQYQVKRLGEEWLDTALGRLLTVKLEQYRPDKERRTLIWMAKDWDYLLVKLKRFEKNKSSYLLELEQATLGGSTVTGSQHR